MKDLYLELLERMVILKSHKPSDEIDGRISELTLVIIRVQQILLNNLNKK